MQSFNRIVSFILAVIVLIVLIALLTGNLNIKDKLAKLTSVKPGTPTITISSSSNKNSEIKGTKVDRISPVVSEVPTKAGNDKNTATTVTKTTNISSTKSKNASKIPASGPHALLIPGAILALWAGARLRRAS